MYYDILEIKLLVVIYYGDKKRIDMIMIIRVACQSIAYI